MKDFVKSLGIEQEGEMVDGQYVIDVENLYELSTIYNILTDSEDVEEDEDSSKVSADFVDIHFDGEDYTITLYGNVDKDKYSVITI